MSSSRKSRIFAKNVASKKVKPPKVVRCYCGVGRNIFLCCFPSISKGISHIEYSKECERIRQKHTKKNRTCLFPGCHNPAIGSHTISKKSQLSKIAKDNHVLKYAEMDTFKQRESGVSTYIDFRRGVGVGEASKAPLFCNDHDGPLFSSIDKPKEVIGEENEKLEEIINLSCYRSICKEIWETSVKENILNDEFTLRNELIYAYSEATKNGMSATVIYAGMRAVLDYHDFMVERTKKKMIMLKLQKKSLDDCMLGLESKTKIDGYSVPIMCHVFVQMESLPVLVGGTLKLFESMLNDRYIPVPISTIDSFCSKGEQLKGYLFSFFDLDKNQTLKEESGIDPYEYREIVNAYAADIQSLIERNQEATEINAENKAAGGYFMMLFVASLSEVFFSKEWYSDLSFEEKSWLHKASQAYPWKHKTKNRPVTFIDCLTEGTHHSYNMKACFVMLIDVGIIQEEAH